MIKSTTGTGAVCITGAGATRDAADAGVRAREYSTQISFDITAAVESSKSHAKVPEVGRRELSLACT